MTPENQKDALQSGYQLHGEAVEYYRKNPVAFVREMNGAEPDQFQRQALEVLADGNWPIIYSGRGPGKTCLLAWIIQWWEYVHPTCKIPVTSVKKEQLSDALWPELKKWLDLSLLREDYVWQKTKFYIRGREEQNFAVARTGASTEGLQGFHDPFMLVVIEEASWCTDELFDALVGSMTQDGNCLVMAGNPLKSSGPFYNAFTRPSGRMRPIHIPCVDKNGKPHPNVSQDFLTFATDNYGKDSNFYRIYVLGLPPRTDDDTVISWEDVNHAASRDDIVIDMAYKVVWGVDVARYGDDKSTLAKRCGNVQVGRIKTWEHLDGPQLAGRVAMEYGETAEEMRPERIFVDVIGVGASAYDAMRMQGLPVTPVNVNTATVFSDECDRLRDELWWRGRAWFKSGNVSIDEDEDLIAELTTPKYSHTMSGKVSVESKRDFKKRLPRRGSPDRADSLLLTFMSGVDLLPVRKRGDTYFSGNRDKPRPWMAA